MRVHLLGSEKGLNEAYNLTEQEQPDLVVVAADQVILPEFPMYAAMLDILHLDCLVLLNGGSEEDLSGTVLETVSLSELQRYGGLGRFLASRCGLRPEPASGRTAEPVGRPRRHASAAQTAGAATPGLAATSKGAENRAPIAGEWRTVVIGASTGGIEALLEVLSHFPANCPPTLIVQHISAAFLPGFAQRLDRHCAATVRPAEQNDTLRPGLVLVAPGNTKHLMIIPPGNRCRLVAGDPVSGHRPSVDALFRSAARLGENVVGVILTGMGRDGAEGLAEIRKAGGMTIGQNAETCTVYGMPRAAQELGAVDEQLDLGRIGPAILKAAARSEKEAAHARP